MQNGRRGRALPLYETVAGHLRDMMISGTLRAGDALPSEARLADEMRVSVGTVRKAIDMLADDGLIIKRQGVGTFILGAVERRELFTLFTLEDANGERRIPEAEVLSIEEREAGKAERSRLHLDQGDVVFRIRRVRTLSGVPVILEEITIPKKIFPGADKIVSKAGHLFKFYEEKYNITIARVNERIKAIQSSKEDERVLKKSGPLLQIDRIAMVLDGRVAEWRISKCVTDTISYVNTRS